MISLNNIKHLILRNINIFSFSLFEVQVEFFQLIQVLKISVISVCPAVSNYGLLPLASSVKSY